MSFTLSRVDIENEVEPEVIGVFARPSDAWEAALASLVVEAQSIIEGATRRRYFDELESVLAIQGAMYDAVLAANIDETGDAHADGLTVLFRVEQVDR